MNYSELSLIDAIVYTIERRSMAGILTPTVRKFWRAYIEKTRETTSTIDSPYIEASYDPYTDFIMTPYTSPLPKPLLPPYIEATSPTTSPTTKLPLHWPLYTLDHPPLPPTPTTLPLPPTLPNLLPLHLPLLPPSHSPWRGASPLSPSALRARDPLSPFPKF